MRNTVQTQVDTAMLRLDIKDATRVLQWFPFQSRQADVDQILAEQLNQAVSGNLRAIQLTRGDCTTVTRWFRSLIPAMIKDVDIHVNDKIEWFLNRQVA